MHLKLSGFVTAFAYVNGTVAHVAYGDTAARILAKIVYKVFRYEAPVVSCKKAAGRGLNQSVFKQNSADLKGVKDMGIL